MLSGALFPISGASKWIGWIMRVNPLTYGTEALRALLFPGTSPFTVSYSLTILVIFTLVMFTMSFVMANRRSTKPAV